MSEPRGEIGGTIDTKPFKMESTGSGRQEWKPPMFSKTEDDVQRYFRQFKRVARANSWSEESRGVADGGGGSGGGGGPNPRTFENRVGGPPRFENEVAKIRCFFRFLGYFGVGWPPCRRFDPPTQKSVATPLEERQLSVLPALFVEEAEWVADELEKAIPATVQQAEELAVRLLCPKEKRKVKLHLFYEARLVEHDEPRKFVQDLRQLLKAGMPDLNAEAQEEMIMEQLPRAVPSKWQVKLLDSDATTVEALVRRLERLKTVEHLHQEMSKAKKSSDHYAEVRHVTRFPRLCFQCGQPGHLQAQCSKQTPKLKTRAPPEAAGARGPVPVPAPATPAPVPAHAGPATPLRCYNCGEGHISRSCPSPRRRDVRRLETSKPELKVSVKINNVKTVGVLDTGSAVSLLREDEARKLGCAVRQLDDVQCVAANGTDVTVAGQVEVPVVLGSVFTMHQFHIVEHLSDPVLLGMDLLRKIGATIDCGTGELSVSGEKIPVQPPGHDVVTKEELTCPPRTESMFVIRRVATAEAHVFEPMDDGGVELVAALYNDVACQGVPVRVLNLKEEEVLIPAGTVLGKTSPAQEVIVPGPADLGAGTEAAEEDVGYKLPTGEHLHGDEDQCGHRNESCSAGGSVPQVAVSGASPAGGEGPVHQPSTGVLGRVLPVSG